MYLLSKHPQAGTIILLIFFGLWCYTEVAEYIERDSFKRDVTSFMNVGQVYHGDRFTKEQAEKIISERKSREKELSDRIERLEKCSHEECK